MAALVDASMEVLIPVLGLWVIMIMVFYFITMIQNVMDDRI